MPNLLAKSAAKSGWIFHVNAGSCNGCDIELVSILTPRYDAERLGFRLAESPRQADIVAVSGPITMQTRDRLVRVLSQVPEPRVVLSLGSCPRSCNVFKGSYSVAGPLDRYTTVDVSDVPDVKAGDEVVCFGTCGRDSITPDDWAALKGTHAYDIICSLGNRVQRVTLR